MGIVPTFLLLFLSLLQIAAAILGVVAFARTERLRREIVRLSERLGGLERPLQTAAPTGQAVESAAKTAEPPPEPPKTVEAPSAPPAIARGTTAPMTTAPFEEPAQAPDGGFAAGLEALVGGRLSVLLGGLALALGGVFLVSYTIEAGLLGPAARVFLGVLLAALLAGAGEYLRRSEQPLPAAARTGGLTPYIPGALTAAAIVTALATIYAAHALYGFIGAIPAFVLLAAVSFAALAISAIHGPALAALGMLGSFATPALVQSTTPAPLPLFAYLLVVALACFFTAYLRRWVWLSAISSVLAAAWGFVWLATRPGDSGSMILAVYAIALAIGAVLLLRRDSDGSAQGVANPASEQIDDWRLQLPALGLGALDMPLTLQLVPTALLALGLGQTEPLGAATLLAVAGFSIVLGWGGWNWRSLTLLPALAALTFLLVYLANHQNLRWLVAAWQGAPHETGPMGTFLWVGGLFGIGFGAVGALALARPCRSAAWTAVSALTPILTLIIAYWVTTGFATSIPFALVAAGLSMAFAVITERLDREQTDLLGQWSVGAYAAAAVATLALALTMVLEKGWLTVALALMAPGLAIINQLRPIAILRWLIAGLAGLLALRLLQESLVVGYDVGTTPIFNWILYGYGVPTVGFWFSARTLRAARDDIPVRVAEGASIAFLTVLIGKEIHHLMTGGYVYAPTQPLAELGLHTLSWLGLSLGLRMRAPFEERVVYRTASLLLGCLGIATMIFGSLVLHNPAVKGEPVGGLVINDLMIAYALPALLSLCLAWLAEQHGQVWLSRIAAGAALVMAFAYVTFQTGRVFEGPVVSLSMIEGSELYAYSAVWLLFGIALLAAGIVFNRPGLRQVAFGVVTLATLKVFLVDMAGLGGLLRPLSFIGLGLALIGIGLAYQRLVLRPRNETPTTSDSPPSKSGSA
jgi:uncharacterized membrane protein